LFAQELGKAVAGNHPPSSVLVIRKVAWRPCSFEEVTITAPLSFDQKDCPAQQYRSFTQIAAGDLHVAVLGQLTTAQLAFHDKLEPGAL